MRTNGAELFDIDAPVAGACSVRELLQASMAVVARARIARAQADALAGSTGCGAGPGPGCSRGSEMLAAGIAAGACRGPGVVALFLPRNTDLLQLAGLVPAGSVWHAERNFINGFLQGLTLYSFPSD